MSTKQIIVVLVALLIVANAIFFVPKLTGKAVNENNQLIKIGLIGVMSGEAATWGQSGLAGATLAVNEINEKGGINGRKVQLISEDDKLSAKDSANAFNKLINIDEVVAIIGSSGSGPTIAGIPIAQDNKVPFMTVCASAPKVTQVGNYIFRDYPSDSFQGKFAAEFLFNKLGKKKVAFMYINNDWGVGIKPVFEKRFKELGGEIVYETSFMQDQKDFKTEISKVKEANAEALYFLVYPSTALAGFKQIKEMNLDIPVYAGDAIEDEAVWDSQYSEGIMYGVAKINYPDSFKKKINNLPGFEDLKPNFAAATGYDAMKIIAKAIEKVGTDKQKLRDEIAKTSYNGISSPVIEFNSNGDLKEAVFEAKIIKNKEAIELNL